MRRTVLISVILQCLVSARGYSSVRIVNGTDAEKGEFAFIASLRLRVTGSHRCGSSLIAKDGWILTAAHCVHEYTAEDFSVQYGVTEISRNGPNVVNVSRVIIHEDYEPWMPYVHDIALLKISDPLELSDSVSLVNLPSLNQHIPAESPAILAGWGLNTTGGASMNHLHKVNLIVFSDEECNQRHNSNTRVSNICGGIPEGGKGQCNGDSGGPLVVNNTLVGIVSWSIKPCAGYPYPGVYTKVAYYIDWIKAQTRLSFN